MGAVVTVSDSFVKALDVKEIPLFRVLANAHYEKGGNKETEISAAAQITDTPDESQWIVHLG